MKVTINYLIYFKIKENSKHELIKQTIKHDTADWNIKTETSIETKTVKQIMKLDKTLKRQ